MVRRAGRRRRRSRWRASSRWTARATPTSSRSRAPTRSSRRLRGERPQRGVDRPRPLRRRCARAPSRSTRRSTSTSRSATTPPTHFLHRPARQAPQTAASRARLRLRALRLRHLGSRLPAARAAAGDRLRDRRSHLRQPQGLRVPHRGGGTAHDRDAMRSARMPALAVRPSTRLDGTRLRRRRRRGVGERSRRACRCDSTAGSAPRRAASWCRVCARSSCATSPSAPGWTPARDPRRRSRHADSARRTTASRDGSRPRRCARPVPPPVSRRMTRHSHCPRRSCPAR